MRPNRSASLFVLLGVGCSALFVGCPGSLDSESGRNRPSVSQVMASPRTVELAAVGDTVQIVVTAHFSDGSQRDISRASDGTQYQAMNLDETHCEGAISVSADGLITAMTDESCQASVGIDVVVDYGDGSYLPTSANDIIVETGVPAEEASDHSPLAPGVIYASVNPNDPILFGFLPNATTQLDVYGERDAEGLARSVT